MFKHSVQDYEELTHTGSNGYLFGLSCSAEMLVECPDNRVIPHSHQGSHKESCPYCGSATPDSALVSKGAAVPVKWGDSYQGSSLSTVQGAQFREFAQECG